METSEQRHHRERLELQADLAKLYTTEGTQLQATPRLEDLVDQLGWLLVQQYAQQIEFSNELDSLASSRLAALKAQEPVEYNITPVDVNEHVLDVRIRRWLEDFLFE